MWTINVHLADNGDRFYTVSIQTGSDEVRFTVTSERAARKLRDTLNDIDPAVTAFAL